MNLPQFKPVVLIVLDGVGIARNGPGNAVKQAKTPYLESLWSSFPSTSLIASGEDVGLPAGVKGNSEVGHLNLGCGQIVYQELPRINKSIKNGSYYINNEFYAAFIHSQKNKSKIHVVVCFSKGSVHGTIDHLTAFLESAKKAEVKQEVIIHAFTDGRDSPPKSAAIFFNQIDQTIHRLQLGKFGTIIGRYWAMDRNRLWDRTKIAYDSLVHGKGTNEPNWKNALQKAYENGETDEFIKPIIINNSNDTRVKDGDSFIFLNYRADRAIQLTRALVEAAFSEFERGEFLSNLYFVGMSQYAKGIPEHIAYPKENIDIPLGRLISESDKRQLRISESEKFPHVTYFFNGGRSVKFEGEDRLEIPSPSVSTYDKMPEMSLFEVTEVINQKLALNIYDFILLNIANGDMVGHTGNIKAGKIAMEAVDLCVRKIVKSVTAFGGVALITADHGNIEEMLNTETGLVDTEHSSNPVPFILVPPIRYTQKILLKTGILSDVSPTIIELMDLTRPSSMVRSSLIRN
ncbi:MAG: 2,3-bisphosphoglycerate-independent phosphoglycerate mutase [bacterium]